MNPTPRRLPALLALALGGFGIGVAEFVAMGLLPQIASSLLPGLWATSQEEALARAGAIISAYALGAVIGAFTLAILTVRMPRKVAVVLFAVFFAVGSVLSAVAPTFEVLVLARFLAALPHGAYFGFASLIAGQLMGPGGRGRGIAFVLSGLTIANVIGVPLITVLGQHLGWRAAYLTLAGIFLLAVLAIVVTVPTQPGNPDATVRAELRVFTRPQVWFALGIGAIGFGGFFAVYSYVSGMVTELAGLSERWVAIALVVVGLGMTVGNILGGPFADRGALPALLKLFPVFALTFVALATLSAHPVALFVLLFVMSAVSMAMMPAIQTRLLDVSGDAVTLASALNHASLNLGNSIGAALGGAVIAAGFGFAAPGWVGLACAAVGLALAWGSHALERRTPA